MTYSPLDEEDDEQPLHRVRISEGLASVVDHAELAQAMEERSQRETGASKRREEFVAVVSVDEESEAESKVRKLAAGMTIRMGGLM